ncbi:hypothetical protein ONZ45_g2752 [Pleurotus djamor]|nr:hypothetical protein ONZ45_g2752 [Pleurotus djamor]
MLKSSTTRKGAVGTEKINVDDFNGLQYPYRLSFYDRPPTFDVTLEEFETSALDRLRILAEIESSAVRNRTWEETKEVVKKLCDKYTPLHSSSAIHYDRDAERRKDILGHFVLRLAFSRTEELRRRFLKAESTLFKVRFEDSDSSERTAFLNSRSFNWEHVSNDEKTMYRDQLSSIYVAPKGQRDQAFAKESYLKVRWTRVPDLVSSRKAFLKGGWAYVPMSEQASIIYQEFETSLEQALLLTSKALPRLDEDTRLDPILDNLSKGFLAGVSSGWDEGNADKEHITADMVDSLAKQHFPLCMQHIHQKLTRDRHLMHFGRLQYGLFLKVLGLPIEEALIFWRKSFSKITDDEFNKKYKYNFRHSYGLEGRKANYPAMSCSQILIPSNKDTNYVCPYKHFSPENLQTALLSSYSARGMTQNAVMEVMGTVKAGHPHVACTRVFEITHANEGVKKGDGVGGGESVTHPNQYASSFVLRLKLLADLVTIMNGVCGSLSIFSSAQYLCTGDTDFLWSALSLPLAGLMFDFLDGKVARWRKSSSLLGQELDSLADLISFGVAPALLAFVIGLRTYLDQVCLTGFICCGLARLARFNATVALVPKNSGGKAKYFEGLPIPSSLGLVAILSYWAKNDWIEGKLGIPFGTITLWGDKGGRGELHLVSIVFALWAMAMVSKTLRVPKL